MTSAEAAKEKGNAHFKAEEWSLAVEEFTKAIEEDSGNYVYFSNRAGAFQQLKEYKKALADANECIRLKPDWPKGFGRQGAALFSLGRFKEARAAYSEVLKLDPTNSTYTKERMRCDAELKKPSKLTRFLVIIAHLAVVLFGVVAIVPLGIGYASWSVFLKLALFVQMLHIVRTIGRPRFNKEYLQQFLFDPESHYVILATILHLGRPFFLGVVPQVGRSLLLVSSELKTLPVPLADKLGKFAELRQDVFSLTAQIEVFIGFWLVLDLLTPSRNPILLLTWWQYMRMRYLLSLEIQNRTNQPQPILVAFSLLRAKVDVYLLGPRAPGFVQSGYLKVIAMMSNAVDPVIQQQQAQGSWFSRCSIM